MCKKAVYIVSLIKEKDVTICLRVSVEENLLPIASIGT